MNDYDYSDFTETDLYIKRDELSNAMDSIIASIYLLEQFHEEKQAQFDEINAMIS